MTCKKCGEKRKLLRTGYCESCNEEFCDELAGRIIQAERGYGMSMHHINKNKIKFIKTFKKE